MLLKQTGSAILQVILAAAAIGGASVAFLKSQETSNRQQVKINYSQDLLQITEQIQGALARSQNCWVTINRPTMDGIYVGDPEDKNNYFKGFTEIKKIFSLNEQIGNSGIMMTDIRLVSEAAGDFLEVRFKAKEGVKLAGSSDELVKFRIKYSLNMFGARNSCYSEEGEDISEGIENGCLDLEGVYSGEKCNLVSIPTCVLNPEPCGTIWKDQGKLHFLREVGSNPGFEPKNSFADATYSNFSMNKCCRQQLPLNP